MQKNTFPQRHRLDRRTLVTIITVALTSSILGTIPAIAAPEIPTENLLLAYNFTEESGSTVTNVATTGTGYDGTVQGGESWDAGIMNFTGSNYVKLPDNLLLEKTSATIVTEVAPRSESLTGNVFLWNIGGTASSGANDGTGQLFIQPATPRISISPTNYSKEVSAKSETKLSADTWTSLAATISDNGDGTSTLRLFIDGTLAAENASSTVNLSDLITQTNNLLGKSAYSADKNFQGKISSFRVYDSALSEAQLQDISQVDAVESAKRALDAIDLGDTHNLTRNLTLPTSGGITWTSSNPAVISNDGVISATPAIGEAVLTASIALRGQTKTRNFEVTVAPELTVDQKAQADLDTIELLGTDDTRGNITVPLAGTEYSSAVTWASSAPATVSDQASGEIAAGVVNRPPANAEPKTVTLTATVAGTSAERAFTLTVQPLTEAAEDDKYGFAYFTGNGNGQEQVFFAASDGNDALNWDVLNNGNASLTSSLGTKGLRDPFIMRSVEGDKFYLIATDLHVASGNGWGTRNGSRSISIWESTDLQNWGEQRLVEVVPENFGSVWAPEAYWDSSLGAYVVYWSSHVYTDSTQSTLAYSANTTLWYSTTRDFVNFTEAKPWQTDTSYGDRIDSTVIQVDDTYYRFTKADNTKNNAGGYSSDILSEKSTSLRTETTAPNSGWELVATGIGKKSGTQDVEGPSIFKANDNDVNLGKLGVTNGYYLFADEYGGGGYRALFSNDIEASVWTMFPKSDNGTNTPVANLPSSPRHGTVLSLTTAQWCSLKNDTTSDECAPYSTGAELVSLSIAEVEVDLSQSTLSVQIPNLANLTEADIEYEVANGATVSVSIVSSTVTLTVTSASGSVKTYKVTVSSTTPIARYTFEDGTGKDEIGHADLTLSGNSAVITDESTNSKVLQLDGGSSSYASFPQGFFDGLDQMTISMDVRSDLTDGNFFTFTFGQNAESYYFLRLRGTTLRSAITTSAWTGESAVTGTIAADEWHNVKVIFAGNSMKVYVDQVLIGENDSLTSSVKDLGNNLLGYLGKSFYGADQTFKGAYDNVEIYNRALTDKELLEGAPIVSGAQLGTVVDDPASTTGTDDHTAVTSLIDKTAKTITSYVRKSADVASIPTTFALVGSDIQITLNGESFTNGDTVDYSQGDQNFTLRRDDVQETWTVKQPIMAGNPVLPGQYADPDIDILDGKFWIFPTTDGYSGWSGTLFHAFSSSDLVNWTDEGIILDANKDSDSEYVKSPWSVGSAWAPSIEEKDGKYYFYYSAKKPDGESAIGVAWADDPAGPYSPSNEPLITRTMNGVTVGQAIDASIFTDDDGTSYVTYGNGNGAIVQLNDDMLSVDLSTVQKIDGMTDFRESVVVVKANGMYHWTWSVDDTGSENYRVYYGVSDSLYDAVTYKYPLLVKDASLGILGTAHQSILQNGEDTYIAYHRFYTPLGIYTEGLGYHRETAIDVVQFDENGYMLPVTPTMEGVEATTVAGEPSAEPSVSPSAEPSDKPNPSESPEPSDQPNPSEPTKPSTTPATIGSDNSTDNAAATSNKSTGLAVTGLSGGIIALIITLLFTGSALVALRRKEI